MINIDKFMDGLIKKVGALIDNGTVPHPPMDGSTSDAAAMIEAASRMLNKAMDHGKKPSDFEVVGVMVGTRHAIDQWLSLVLLNPETRREAVKWKEEEEKNQAAKSSLHLVSED